MEIKFSEDNNSQLLIVNICMDICTCTTEFNINKNTPVEMCINMNILLTSHLTMTAFQESKQRTPPSYKLDVKLFITKNLWKLNGDDSVQVV